MSEGQTELSENTELFARRSIDDTVKLLFKNLVLINGGAAAAILAFAGNVLSHAQPDTVHNAVQLAAPLTYFSFGVGFAAAAIAASYFSGFYGHKIIGSMNRQIPIEPRIITCARWSFYLTVLFTLASLALFFGGVWASHNAIAGFFN